MKPHLSPQAMSQYFLSPAWLPIAGEIGIKEAPATAMGSLQSMESLDLEPHDGFSATALAPGGGEKVLSRDSEDCNNVGK